MTSSSSTTTITTDICIPIQEIKRESPVSNGTSGRGIPVVNCLSRCCCRPFHYFATPHRAIVSSKTQPSTIPVNLVSENDYYTFCNVVNQYIQSYDQLWIRRKRISYAAVTTRNIVLLVGGHYILSPAYASTTFNLWLMVLSVLALHVYVFVLIGIEIYISKVFRLQSVWHVQNEILCTIINECSKMSERFDNSNDDISSSSSSSSLNRNVTFTVMTKKYNDFFGANQSLDHIKITITTISTTTTTIATPTTSDTNTMMTAVTTNTMSHNNSGLTNETALPATATETPTESVTTNVSDEGITTIVTTTTTTTTVAAATTTAITEVAVSTPQQQSSTKYQIMSDGIEIV